jgi:hypothetical protein
MSIKALPVFRPGAFLYIKPAIPHMAAPHKMVKNQVL